MQIYLKNYGRITCKPRIDDVRISVAIVAVPCAHGWGQNIANTLTYMMNHLLTRHLLLHISEDLPGAASIKPLIKKRVWQFK
jgi:hypothetical protein